MTAQVEMFGANVDATGTAGDALDRYYTPMPLARACVERVRSMTGKVETVLEPSCGGGTFVRELRRQCPGAVVHSVDPDADAAGHELADVQHRATLSVALAEMKKPAWDMAAGNPPFALAQQHIALLVPVVGVLGLILPMDWLGGRTPKGSDVSWMEVLSGPIRPQVIYPIVGRPWGDHVREVGLWLWSQHIPRWDWGGVQLRHNQPIRWRS